jgi:RNA polymerase sigma-70 factor (ECF subfamily)
MASGGPANAFPIDRFDDLLAGARAGRPASWDRLYHWLAPAVAGYLRVQGAHEVDDLTSEVFLAVFRNIGTFTGSEANFRSWVFVIAHRRLQDERRRRTRRPAAESFDESSAHPAARAAEQLAAPLDTADEVLKALERARIERICSRLSPDQRNVLLLRIVGDLTLEQVAEVLGKSTDAVKQLQRRAFEAVRGIVEREGVTL